MPKLIALVLIAGAAAAAYVAGTKAGRARYREISATAKRMWDDPAVEKMRKRAYAQLEKTAKRAADKIPT
ncbi:hypothetical protein ACH3VR_09785 [Microbacterium sp. B2969]|uniref:YtxH domain-containing protein n=1 Tax=Microbacterium alkaliflavum TaxID=3248839 RepID=A0ABW7Q707_9MICO